MDADEERRREEARPEGTEEKEGGLESRARNRTADFEGDGGSESAFSLAVEAGANCGLRNRHRRGEGIGGDGGCDQRSWWRR